eukprot:3428233-Amphidinium_carterae.1
MQHCGLLSLEPQFGPLPAGGVRMKAYAIACSTVGICIPIRSFACSIRVMYFASSPQRTHSSARTC